LGLVARILSGLSGAREGYRLEFQGRAGILYADDRGVVSVDGEMLVGERSYVVYLARMKLLTPGTRSELDDVWRAEIVARIERAVGRGKLEVAA
jgi:hypothetical protein